MSGTTAESLYAAMAASSSSITGASGPTQKEHEERRRARRTLRGYPRRGFSDIELGEPWEMIPVEIHKQMVDEAKLRRNSGRNLVEKFCPTCSCASFPEGLTEECCLSERGFHCSFTVMEHVAPANQVTQVTTSRVAPVKEHASADQANVACADRRAA